MRLVIVEDDSRYRESLETLFRNRPGYTLVESFGAATEAIRHLGEQEVSGNGAAWDLVLMDLELPGMSGIEATRRIKKQLPDALVVVLTVFEEPATILEAICAGADGYLLKKTTPQELLAQLRIVAAGGSPLTADVARTVLGLLRSTDSGGTASSPPFAPGRFELSHREQQVLRCLVRGLAYKQVAEELEISLDTVRHHIRGVYRKLQVHSVAEAVSRAIRERLV